MADIQQLMQDLYGTQTTAQSSVPSAVNNGNPGTVYNTAASQAAPQLAGFPNAIPSSLPPPQAPWDFTYSQAMDPRPIWDGNWDTVPLPPAAPPPPSGGNNPPPSTGGNNPPNIYTPPTQIGGGNENGGGGYHFPSGGGGSFGGGGTNTGGGSTVGGGGNFGGGLEGLLTGLGGTWAGGKLGVGPDGTYDWQQGLDTILDLAGIKGDWWASNVNEWNKSEIMQGVLNEIFPGLGTVAQKFALSPLAHRLGLVPEWLKDMVLDGKITESENKQRGEMMKQWEADLQDWLDNMGADASKKIIDMMAPPKKPKVTVGPTETVSTGGYGGNAGNTGDNGLSNLINNLNSRGPTAPTRNPTVTVGGPTTVTTGGYAGSGGNSGGGGNYGGSSYGGNTGGGGSYGSGGNNGIYGNYSDIFGSGGSGGSGGLGGNVSIEEIIAMVKDAT